ncbi:MAG TPA: hypothetical protein VGR48_05905 [Terriglobales bacterium]|nr:hypothetical protein [Terriglobales bacterium]
MDEVTARIERVAEDLRMIQQELNLAAMQTPPDPEQELISVEALETLKSALDQMRHFLWFYCQVVNQESDLREKLRQALRQGTDEESETATVMDQLARAANRAFSRYRLNGKKPN